MAYKQNSSAVVNKLFHTFFAFLLESIVTNNQHFVSNKNIRVCNCGDGKGNTGNHTGGIVFQRYIKEVVQFGKIHNFLEMFQIGIIANFSLAFVNLVPLPPLDGGHIIEGLLPRRLANAYAGIGRYGFLILVVLLASGMLSSVLTPLIRWSWNTTLTIYGL